MKKYLKGMAIVAMAAAVAVTTPAVVLAGDAGMKKVCMEGANLTAECLKGTGGNTYAALAAIKKGVFDKISAGGTTTITDTELLWTLNNENSVEIRIYPGIRKVTVIGKQPGVYETATTSY